MKVRLAIFLTVMLFLSMKAFATTGAANASTVSPTLQVNVTVQKAVQLTLSTGTTCTVGTGSGADYAITIGTVDALGLSTPTCGNKYAPTTPGVTGSVYYSDYKLTPATSGQTGGTTASVKAYVSTPFANPTVLAVMYSTSAPTGVASFSAMSTSSASQNSLISSGTNGTAVTSYIGVQVSVQNGASAFTGNDQATVTYTLTVP